MEIVKIIKKVDFQTVGEAFNDRLTRDICFFSIKNNRAESAFVSINRECDRIVIDGHWKESWQKEKWQQKKDGERKKRETGGKDKENSWGRERAEGWTAEEGRNRSEEADLLRTDKLHGHRQEGRVGLLCSWSLTFHSLETEQSRSQLTGMQMDHPPRGLFTVPYAALVCKLGSCCCRRDWPRASRDPSFLLQLPKPFSCLCATQQGQPRPQISNTMALPWLCSRSQIWLQSSHFVPVTRLWNSWMCVWN